MALRPRSSSGQRRSCISKRGSWPSNLLYAGGVRASHESSDRLEIRLSLTRDLGMNLAGVEIILNCAKRWTPCNASSNVSSNDAGKKWSRITNDYRLIQRAWYYIELFIDPKNENTIYVMSALDPVATTRGSDTQTTGIPSSAVRTTSVLRPRIVRVRGGRL